MYLVTGATGNVGRHVVDQLLSLGKNVRIVTRDAAKTSPWNGRVQVAEGDATNADFFADALHGVEAAFIMNGGLDPQMFARNMSRANDNGNPRIVFLSSILVHHPAMRIGSMHRVLENSVREVGLRGTFIRPGGFMTNACQWIAGIKADGTVRNPSGNGRSAPVAPEDIAAVAAKALVEPDKVPETCDLTGPELLTVPEQVDILSKRLGRVIRCQEVPAQAAVQRLISSGIPTEMAAAVGEAWEAAATGRLEFLSDTVEKLTGRPAMSFGEWTERHVSRFA